MEGHRVPARPSCPSSPGRPPSAPLPPRVRPPLRACSSLTHQGLQRLGAEGPRSDRLLSSTASGSLAAGQSRPWELLTEQPPWASTRVHGQQGSLGGPTAPGQGQAGISRCTACRHQRPSQQGWGGDEGGQTSRGRARGPEGLGLQEAVHTHQTSV